MKKLGHFVIITVIFAVCSGCAVNLPFNNRLSYPAVRDAKSLSATTKGPIAVKWHPSSFPDRIDVQGASGYVGSASQTRIPTGVGLASRILEAFDNSIGLLDSAKEILIIDVIKAETEFEYSAGFFNITPAIDVGRCNLVAEFTIGNKRWRGDFFF